MDFLALCQIGLMSKFYKKMFLVISRNVFFLLYLIFIKPLVKKILIRMF